MSRRLSLGAPSDRQTDPHRIALLTDTHIAANPAHIVRNINMTNNLQRACTQVLELDQRPARMLIGGDFAFKSGEAADYAAAVKLLEPIRAAGMPVDIALGNHDHRERFWEALPPSKPSQAPVKARHVGMVEMQRADWIILDSLVETDVTRGGLGAEQLAWLAVTLDARPSKPAIVLVHHDPELKPSEKPIGIADTAALLDVISPRRQAKALIYGHCHRWIYAERDDGLHLVNLPPTAYVFAAEQPSGWVDAHLERAGATLELRCLDPKHTWHGQKLAMNWRV
jgi:3',5'-cyclic-AMP phosphodiesterase